MWYAHAGSWRALLASAPNPPLQRTRFAPRDRCSFRTWYCAERDSDLNCAPLNGNPLDRELGQRIILAIGWDSHICGKALFEIVSSSTR